MLEPGAAKTARRVLRRARAQQCARAYPTREQRTLRCRLRAPARARRRPGRTTAAPCGCRTDLRRRRPAVRRAVDVVEFAQIAAIAWSQASRGWRLALGRMATARPSPSVALSLDHGIASVAAGLVGADDGASASRSVSITADDRDVGSCMGRLSALLLVARLLFASGDSEVGGLAGGISCSRVNRGGRQKLAAERSAAVIDGPRSCLTALGGRRARADAVARRGASDQTSGVASPDEKRRPEWDA